MKIEIPKKNLRDKMFEENTDSELQILSRLVSTELSKRMVNSEKKEDRRMEVCGNM